MGPDRRTAERGLSLLEALVMIVVMALVSSIVFGAVQRDAQRNYGLADRAIVTAGQARAEADFRRLMAGAIAAPRADGEGVSLVEGTSLTARITTRLTSPNVCGAGVSAQPLVVSIMAEGTGGALQCETVHASGDLLRWAPGDARFSYSIDGVTWRAAWPPVERRLDPDTTTSGDVPAPLVRLTIAADGRTLVWIARAGSTARAADIAPPQAPMP